MPLMSRKGILAIAAVIDAPRTSCAPPAAEELGDPPLPTSLLVNNVVRPTLAEAERRFSAALARINVEDMARQVEALK
jgi:hypothetical protein